MSTDALYPPAPANVPSEITRLDSTYRLRVVAMIGGLFLFLILYMAFIAAAGSLAYWLLVMPVPEIRGRGVVAFLVLKFGGAFAALLLWLFLFKGLFKGQKVQRSAYVALDEQDHPILFDFIRRVYRDTGSRRPRRVYASPDVNAALIYNTSLINLVVPPRKDLLIGLGLVNVVNLSEFKAVLAHEFGHFAQRSVGLGSYLYVANRVMHDVIYSRDALDRFVDNWSRQDIRLSFPAWGLKGVLWVVRKILAGAFQGLHLLHLSLSRQMEYNADNVAVSVTGSDALIHGLARLGFANECFGDAARSLDAAADHDLFTDDLFYHQSHAADRLRRLRKDDRIGLPPRLPDDPAETVQVFQPAHDGIPDRYRSHPTDAMRERNAKRIYVRNPQDDRSPWLLFGRITELKTAVTERFYRHSLGRTEAYAPRPAAAVQQFIDAEHAESTFDPRYHGLFDDRFLNPGDIQPAPDQACSRDQVEAWLRDWPPADLQQRMEAHNERRSEAHLLRGLQRGELIPRDKTFPFRDQQRSLRDVEGLLTVVSGELNADVEAFARLDRQMFLAHWSLARDLDGGENGGNGREAELLHRYRFHLIVQSHLSGMFGEQARLQAILGMLSGKPQLSEPDFRKLCDALAEIRSTLNVNLEDARSIAVPSLTNVPAGSKLYSLVVDRGDTDLPPLSGDGISGEWLRQLLVRLEGVISRLQRVHFKSLGSLLACQDKLVTARRALSPDQACASPAAPQTAVERRGVEASLPH